jgi:hypothetical protein
VHIVGVILMLAGVAGLLLPRLAGGQLHPDRLRRWVRPGSPPIYDEPPTVTNAGVYDDHRALVQDHSAADDRPPLVGDLAG